MSKTLLSIIIIAGVIIVFVIARFVGLDTGQFSPSGQGIKDFQHNHEFEAWIKFEPKDGSFAASFPREPAHVNEDSHDGFGLTPREYDIYAADGLDKKGYMIEVIRFPKGPDPEADEQILQNTLRDIISQSTRNTLLESKDTDYKGSKALSFKIDNGERILNGVIFVKNKTLYILTRISPENFADNSDDYQFFIQSIEFPDSKSKKGK